ncbi:hypothetical protein PUNSTDRAFT_53512 [Punctularia strigosozonata HHB-11173 SS5]|uniref:uncharacterized protein n=1 Tax=Punctularia strigosozonata (strain HHB-11173) TaxID=741275 RepID=UPI0004417D38|nr:uncharacterized protein PUNSTDRAFT_53512 [Punctularia strigosozonata HHB-11173 SS5]EIN07113.1 hypothetical protein PUNSTDRAFT_53512 [Punctularia strigosozonata HHB-11173 SS5]
MTRHSLELVRWPSGGSHHKEGQYAPSSKRSDISRLLDPAYLPGPVASSSYSSGASSSLSHSPTREVYVDHRGDLHDPDYRHFPPLPTTPTKRRSTSQRVPAWERGYPRTGPYDLDENDEDADASDSEYAQSLSHSRPLTPVPRVTRSASNPARSRPKGYSTYYTDAYYSDHGHTHSASPSRVNFSGQQGHRESPLHHMRHESFFESITPTGSYVQEPQSFVANEDDEEEALSEKKLRRHLRRKSKKSKSEQDESDEKPSTQQPEQDETTPSCSQSLRVAFRALSFRLRYRLFRAQRTVRHKIGQTRARDG